MSHVGKAEKNLYCFSLKKLLLYTSTYFEFRNEIAAAFDQRVSTATLSSLRIPEINLMTSLAAWKQYFSVSLKRNI